MTQFERHGWERTATPLRPGVPSAILWVYVWHCTTCDHWTISPTEHRCDLSLTKPSPEERSSSMTTTRYRKKPVEIDAAAWDGTAVDAGRIIDWMLTEHPESPTPSYAEANETEHKQHAELLISTREGVMHAGPGDFIIVGVQGEPYPCKPDIFAATYDVITNEPEHITIPRPHVLFGPEGVPQHEADARYLHSAADHIEGGYKVGGRNLTATVIKLLHDAGAALYPTTERSN